MFCLPSHSSCLPKASSTTNTQGDHMVYHVLIYFVQTDTLMNKTICSNLSSHIVSETHWDLTYLLEYNLHAKNDIVFKTREVFYALILSYAQ